MPDSPQGHSPNSSSSKNLVLCFDGTDQNFGPEPFTNVLKIFRMLDSSDDSVQMCYYQPGIGTNTSIHGGRTNSIKNKIANTFDSMFAFSLDNHIISAYLFIVKYYEVGDRIIMFGFSRGAFTARVVTGMLERVGILKRGLEDLAPMAWKIYEAWEYAAQPSQPNYTTTLIDEFRNTFSRNILVRVHFEGLFDSVNSCGIIRDRLFPYTSRSGIVDHVRHAVSIDERRGKFKQQSFSPNPYTQKLFSFVYRNYVVEPLTHSCSLQENEANSNSYSESAQFRSSSVPIVSAPSFKAPTNDIFKTNSESAEQLLNNMKAFLAAGAGKENKVSWFRRKLSSLSKQRVEGIFQHYTPGSGSTDIGTFISSDLIEKWFPGDHSDIGGGWPPDRDTNQFISNMPLRWILSEAIKHEVYFKKGILHEFAKSYDSLGSLFSAHHDMLSWKKGANSMKNPFRNNCNPSKNQLDMFHGMLRFPNPMRKVLKVFKWKTNRRDECASTATASHFPDSPKVVFHPVKNEGHGNKSIFQVLLWWFVELIAIGIRIEDKTCKWKNVYIPNLGRPRNIPEYGEMHWSVYWRCKYVGDYKPKNLPPYARKLIEEYIGVRLSSSKDTKHKILTSISSKHVSYPTQESTPFLDREANCQCDRSSLEIDLLKHADKMLLKKWSEEDWMKSPDDLEELLEKYPDL